jgi:hypothetical protein
MLLAMGINNNEDSFYVFFYCYEKPPNSFLKMAAIAGRMWYFFSNRNIAAPAINTVIIM